MYKNMGLLDSFIRLFFGLLAFGFGVSRRNCISIFLGSILTAEGITRFCPIMFIGDIESFKYDSCCCDYDDSDNSDDN